MTFGRQHHPDAVKPGVAVTESDRQRAALVAYGKDPVGVAAIKAVAAHYGIPGGRKWSDLNMREVDLLYRHTLGGEALPAPVDDGIVWTSDESPEGRAFNEKIPFSELTPPW